MHSWLCSLVNCTHCTLEIICKNVSSFGTRGHTSPPKTIIKINVYIYLSFRVYAILLLTPCRLETQLCRYFTRGSSHLLFFTWGNRALKREMVKVVQESEQFLEYNLSDGWVFLGGWVDASYTVLLAWHVSQRHLSFHFTHLIPWRLNLPKIRVYVLEIRRLFISEIIRRRSVKARQPKD